VLFSQTNRLGAPAFPEAPVYPINGRRSQQPVNMFQADLKTAACALLLGRLPARHR
jgi:hypothetical protein